MAQRGISGVVHSYLTNKKILESRAVAAASHRQLSRVVEDLGRGLMRKERLRARITFEPPDSGAHVAAARGENASGRARGDGDD